MQTGVTILRDWTASLVLVSVFFSAAQAAPPSELDKAKTAVQMSAAEKAAAVKTLAGKAAAEKAAVEKAAALGAAIARSAAMLTNARGGWQPLSADAWDYAKARHLLLHYAAQFRYMDSQRGMGNKTIFGKTGNWSGDDLVRLILQQLATARFIGSKLFDFFAQDPDPARGVRVGKATQPDQRQIAGSADSDVVSPGLSDDLASLDFPIRKFINSTTKSDFIQT